MSEPERPTIFRAERVVLPDGVRPAAVHVADGTIVRVTDYDDVPVGATVETFADAALLPGVVDSHVHINEPGRTEWEGFASATRAAAAGGVTTLVEMPLNAVPPTTTVAGLRAKAAAARVGIAVDVGFWGGVVPENTSELGALWRAGVCGFKAFLAPSGVDEFEHVTESDLRAALPALATLDAPLLVHAELPALLRPPADRSAAGRRRYANYLATRPPEAEAGAIGLLIELAAESGVHVHIVHLATAAALPAIERARAAGVRLTVETCPHYLHFAAEEIPDGRTEFKCAPPIRGHADREALWAALGSGALDLIATDHSPCPPALKCAEAGDFLEAWGGIASLQLGLSVAWTGAQPRGYGLPEIARWMSAAPARLAGLPSKGAIAVGRDADLVAFDPDAGWTVDPRQLQHRHAVTPYAGARLTGLVRGTFVRGRCVFRDGVIQQEGTGRLLTGRGFNTRD
ncbi:MAG: allantoinase AllB [Gemmatimonadaceae bacterium]